MNRSRKWFVLLVAAQLAFLLAWAGYHEVIRQSAPVLLLKCRPVDPQDLLRGDYMILDYDICAIPPGTASSGESPGRTIWVLLEKQGLYHAMVRTAGEPMPAGPGQVLVRGTVNNRWRNGAAAMGIDYGIGKFFVPEGRGTPRFELMEAEVSVSPAHRLYLKRVLLDGQAFR